MLKDNSKIDKYSIFIIVAFFFLMIIFYGRGADFDVEAAERKTVIVKDKFSKSFFLIASTVILFILNKKILYLKNIANLRLWGVYFLCLLIFAILRENIVNDLYLFVSIFVSYMMLSGLLGFAYRVKYSVLEDVFIIISVVILILCVFFHLMQGHQIVFFPDRNNDLYDRLGGMLYIAHAAAIAAITFLFSLIKFMRCRKVKYLIIIVFCIIFQLATDTRSAWIASVFSMIFIFFKRINFYKLLFFSISAFFLTISILTFISNKAATAGSEDTEYRSAIWLYSLGLVNQRLFTGYGSAEVAGFANFDMNDNLNDPHNSIISLLLQGGLISVIIYFVIYFKNCNLYLKSSNTDYRFLYYFFLFFPFYWGYLYNTISNFMSMYMMFAIYAFTLHPSIIAKNKIQR